MPRTAAKKRILLKLPGEAAKAFTSEGPKLTGSIVALPAAEAVRFIDLGLALETDAEVCDATPKA